VIAVIFKSHILVN